MKHCLPFCTYGGQNFIRRVCIIMRRNLAFTALCVLACSLFSVPASAITITSKFQTIFVNPYVIGANKQIVVFMDKDRKIQALFNANDYLGEVTWHLSYDPLTLYADDGSEYGVDPFMPELTYLEHAAYLKGKEQRQHFANLPGGYYTDGYSMYVTAEDSEGSSDSIKVTVRYKDTVYFMPDAVLQNMNSGEKRSFTFQKVNYKEAVHGRGGIHYSISDWSMFKDRKLGVRKLPDGAVRITSNKGDKLTIECAFPKPGLYAFGVMIVSESSWSNYVDCMIHVR